MGVFFGFAKILKFQIFFWVLEIPDIFFGVNGRCWARAYVWRKIETTTPPPPPPGGLSKFHLKSWSIQQINAN